nr:hypothetical protein [Tanacetum cinerariifolium]
MCWGCSRGERGWRKGSSGGVKVAGNGALEVGGKYCALHSVSNVVLAGMGHMGMLGNEFGTVEVQGIPWGRWGNSGDFGEKNSYRLLGAGDQGVKFGLMANSVPVVTDTIKNRQNSSKTRQNRAQKGKRGKVNSQRSTKVKPDKIEAKETKKSRKMKKRD